jgi:hypothetical protein
LDAELSGSLPMLHYTFSSIAGASWSQMALGYRFWGGIGKIIDNFVEFVFMSIEHCYRSFNLQEFKLLVRKLWNNIAVLRQLLLVK